MKDPQKEFNEMLATLRWSRNDVAKQLCVNPNVTQRWAEGRSKIPDAVLKWLRPMAGAIKPPPPASAWRQNLYYLKGE